MRFALATALLISTAAFAQSRVSGEDFDTYVKLMNARVKAQARKFYSGQKPEVIKKADADFEAALAAAGWTREKISSVDSILSNIRSALESVNSDEKEIAEEYQRQLKEDFDPATVAMVKSRKSELDTGAATRRAEEEVRNEKQQAAVGRVPSKSELQGSWKFDTDATMAHLGASTGLPAAAMKDARANLESSAAGTVYKFSGDSIEETRHGRTNKGTYRIQGNELLINYGKGEAKMGIGMKSPTEMIFSMFGIGSIYKKQ
jgi:hypothetical protein